VQTITAIRERLSPTLRYVVWGLPVLFAVVQMQFDQRVSGEIRYEELAEAVRNVFFLSHRYVYDGGSTNVGWYETLLMSYSIFGFNLSRALEVRLVLYVASVICLICLFRRWVGPSLSILPVVLISLSPTFLYFNASRTGLGVDLAYVPIVLNFLTLAELNRRASAYLALFLAFSLAMVAALSYPTFLFCFPGLLGATWWRLRRAPVSPGRRHLAMALACSVAGLLTPLVITFAYVENTDTLVVDRATGSGLFRGGGGFDPSLTNFVQTIRSVFRDLAVAGHSYYFDLTKAEFSDFYPLLALLALAVVSGYLIVTVPRLRLPLGIILLTMVAVLIAVGFSRDGSGQPGMRRATVVVAGFYAIFSLAWIALCTGLIASRVIKSLLVGAACLLLIHHVLVLPSNLAGISSLNGTVDDRWFALVGNAQSSLDSLVDRAKVDDLFLGCPQGWSERTPCRYSEVYPAIAGACAWNRLQCHEIYGFDPRIYGFVRLDVTLWTTGRFQH
jgi:hypothetical protein